MFFRSPIRKCAEWLLRSVPNAISIFRIACAPLFFMAIQRGMSTLALIVLLIGAVSDFFDGYIARKFNIESNLGKILDPLADKVFSNVVLWGLYLFCGHHLPILLLAISLSTRDAALLCGSVFILAKNSEADIHPIYLSKVCTTMIFLLCILYTIMPDGSSGLTTYSIICVFMVLLTFAIYIKKAFSKVFN